MVNGPPLFEARHLSKFFIIESGIFRRASGTVQALKDVSFSIEKGETLAVVGGSGCGKSTLARLIVGLLKPDAGTLFWEGRPIESLTRLERARRIQMVFQDPFASLNPKLSVGTQLAEVVSIADCGLRIADLNSRCMELLEAVGLPAGTLLHYPFQFSGGQRQRIAIARALAMRPSLLVADEPLSALDATIQAHILRLLKSLKSAYALTLLFITHDLAVVESFADRVLVLQDGQKVEEGPVASLLSRPQHPYTKALLEAVPRIKV